jgi:hypothetical protein
LKKVDHNIGIQEKRQFFHRKLEKIAENCAHNIDPDENVKNSSEPCRIFVKIKCIALSVEKSSPTMWTTSIIFNKLSRVSNHQLGEKSPILVTLNSDKCNLNLPELT